MSTTIMPPINCSDGRGIECRMTKQYVPARRSNLDMPELTCYRCSTQPGTEVILPIERTIWSGGMADEVMADICPHLCSSNRTNQP